VSAEAYVHRVAEGAPGGALAVLLHGTGGDETQFLGLGRELLPDATLIAPRGDVSEHGALRYFRRRAEGVYDMEDLARATAKMAGFVAAEVAARKPSRVIGLGYSNGANILASVVFARRDLFDDAVLMHPLIAWEPEPGPVRTRVLITAGARDPIAPAALTRQLADWFAAQGAPTETVWHPGGHELAASEIEATAAFLAA
jgi:phospholipase/carboxylesterase